MTRKPVVIEIEPLDDESKRALLQAFIDVWAVEQVQKRQQQEITA